MIEKFHTTLDGVKSCAAYSDCEKYRYLLSRQWEAGNPSALAFIMLNPSTATERDNDPTIERCERRARRGRYGKLIVLNLFAYRATDPEDMKAVSDPVGGQNDEVIRNILTEATLPWVDIICGWGVHGTYRGRDKEVTALFKEYGIRPLALGLTLEGQPRHPLYMPYSARPEAFT